MKIFGFILIAAGALMLVFNGFNFTTEKKVVDVGPIEINKKEDNRVAWPTYAGGLVLLAGIGLVVAGRKK
ncbi:MAG: hypothetical protein H7Y12_01695 [Sphingobacteriaceae bacterium]|nr:hypothetical protein [Cytophagaceae bacterium]